MENRGGCMHSRVHTELYEHTICKKYAEIQKLRYSNPFILYWEYEESVLE